ncbi:MAG: GNAT family N-acetyltransferase, partial [Chloroflexi bacterium]|nr:GNAT family N-acetyltransferase [Chloroflexota bacterium]
DFIRAESRGFGGHASEGYLAHGDRVIEADRTLAAFEDNRIVGTSAAHTFQTTVPGGAAVPTAGIAWVTVQPTHRRRGINTGMMVQQLHRIHERGEPLASLWPSESAIYGRFGYEMAAFAERWTVERQHSALAHAPEERGRTMFVDSDEARNIFPDVYLRVCQVRPGMVWRNDVWWDDEFISIGAEGEVAGESSRVYAWFYIVYKVDGRVDGYVKYRMDHSQRKLIIFELMAATDEAHGALWKYCLGVDLWNSVEARNRPVDDPLLWMLADPGRLRREPQTPLWLRLVDVSEALSQRRYAREGKLVIEVRDSTCPWNNSRFQLDGGPDGAQCRSTPASADLSLSVADLAAGYLGATGYQTLHRASRIQEHRPGSIRLLDEMFATDLKPWCAHDF